MLTESSLIANLGSRRDEDSLVPAAITDVGCEREINEDRYAVFDTTVGRVWVVCDGMGGALGGELAAQLAIDSMRRALESKDADTPEEALRVAIEEANRIIVLRRQNPAFSAMGTTIVAGLIHNDEMVIVHAGDSRAYLIRDEEYQQLTTDHTYVQELVDRGAISPEEALSHPQSHVLTKCLGADPRLELDSQRLWVWPLEEGQTEDKLLLCSDGLYSHVQDEELVEIISQNSPQESCALLVELAKVRGGYDNITVAIVPLGGRLREEESPHSAKLAQKRRTEKKLREAARQNRPVLTMKQRILVMMILAVLGVLCAALFIIFGMSR